MKSINYLVIIGVLILSCGKVDCPDCFSYETAIRFSYENSEGQNLLMPNSQKQFIISKIESSMGQSLNFELIKIKDLDTEYWFIALNNRPNRPGCNEIIGCELCVKEECELYVTYTNSNAVDTLNILYEEIREVDDDGCVCTGYPSKHFKHNGELITEFDNAPNNTGAAIIRK